MNSSRPETRPGGGSRAILGLGGGLLALSGALVIAYVLQAKEAAAVTNPRVAHPVAARTTRAAGAAPKEVRPAVRKAVLAATDAFLDRNVELELKGRRRAQTWRSLGVVPDGAALDREALRFEAAGVTPKVDAYAHGPIPGGMVPVKIDRNKALTALIALRKVFDRSPTNARLDLERRQVDKAVPGYGIDVYGSTSAIELAARADAAKVELDGAPIPPDVTVKDIGVDDISHVLGHFMTRYSVAEKSRDDNLKLVASKLDGYILRPGVLFSFNKVVGNRTMKEGYKIAPVILKGELVDGLAGGSCQISTTLHGAAFFAGLDIVSSQPHSRPSVYVTMGLDATVVYPYVDLKLRNPYPFPVVIHYKVARGESVVQILGKKRPYDRIEFVRQIDKTIPFNTVTRQDPKMPVGSMVIDQRGFPGYMLTRYRLFYRHHHLVKRNKWKLHYAPVTEYVRMGTNPDPNLTPPPPPPTEVLHTPRKKLYKLWQ